MPDDSRAEQIARYLRAVPGGYGQGDRFRGATVPQIRAVVARTALDDDELERLVAGPWHEERMAALLIAVGRVKRLNRLLDRAQARPGSGTQTPPAVRDALAGREALGRRYLGWAARGLVNNWDLVDASAEHLVGAWLLVPLVREADGAPRPPALPEWITALAASRCVWQRRIAVLSTFAATRAGADWPAHAIARRLLDDPHDLIHKAVGWMLREAGKRVDERALTAFLDRHAALMLRTMLRYAIERLDPDARARYRAMRP